MTEGRSSEALGRRLTGDGLAARLGLKRAEVALGGLVTAIQRDRPLEGALGLGRAASRQVGNTQVVEDRCSPGREPRRPLELGHGLLDLTAVECFAAASEPPGPLEGGTAKPRHSRECQQQRQEAAGGHGQEIAQGRSGVAQPLERQFPSIRSWATTGR